MSEIPTYPNECPHYSEPEHCWQCLTTELAITRDALRVAKEQARLFHARITGRREMAKRGEAGLDRFSALSAGVRGDAYASVLADHEEMVLEPLNIDKP